MFRQRTSILIRRITDEHVSKYKHDVLGLPTKEAIHRDSSGLFHTNILIDHVLLYA